MLSITVKVWKVRDLVKKKQLETGQNVILAASSVASAAQRGARCVALPK